MCAIKLCVRLSPFVATLFPINHTCFASYPPFLFRRRFFAWLSLLLCWCCWSAVWYFMLSLTPPSHMDSRRCTKSNTTKHRHQFHRRFQLLTMRRGRWIVWSATNRIKHQKIKIFYSSLRNKLYLYQPMCFTQPHAFFIVPNDQD